MQTLWSLILSCSRRRSEAGIDVYFEGDSITRRWGAIDYPGSLANWKQNFFGWNAADFGWGGDQTQNILWRLENGELDGVNPKVVVLLAGTNNVGDLSAPGESHARADDITRGLQAILRVIRRKAPSATVVVMGIFPRNDNMAFMSTHRHDQRQSVEVRRRPADSIPEH